MKKTTNLTTVYLVTVFALFGIYSSSLQAKTRNLTILHTNDTHARLEPVENTKHGKDIGGIIRRFEFFKRTSAKNKATIMLDAGDIFQGTPFYSFFKGEANHKAFKAAGYTATTLGNHELDNGLTNLNKQLNESSLRLLCCNVFNKTTGKPEFTPYHILKRNGITTAIIGSIGNSAWASIGRKVKAGLYQTDQILTVDRLAKKLNPYVDLIIVLSHSGYEEDIEMGKAIQEIDIILGGHSHTIVNSPTLAKNYIRNGSENNLNGTIVTQAGKYGYFTGVLNISLDNNNNIATYSGYLEKIDSRFDTNEENNLTAIISKYSSSLKKEMDRVIAQNPKELPYPKDDNPHKCLPMGNLATEAMRKQVKADVCLLNSGGIREGLPKGKIMCRHVFEAVPYDNSVVTYKMTGKAIKEMLVALCKNHQKFGGYQFAGLVGKLNFTNNTVSDLQIANKPIKPDQIYQVCTSSFVAEGNLGGDVLFSQAISKEDSGVFMRHAVINYLENNKKLVEFSDSALKIITSQ